MQNDPIVQSLNDLKAVFDAAALGAKKPKFHSSWMLDNKKEEERYKGMSDHAAAAQSIYSGETKVYKGKGQTLYVEPGNPNNYDVTGMTVVESKEATKRYLENFKGFYTYMGQSFEMASKRFLAPWSLKGKIKEYKGYEQKIDSILKLF